MKSYKRFFSLLLLLGVAVPTQTASWSAPTLESIKKAISEHKLIAGGLAGVAAITGATVAFFKSDIGATSIDDPSLYWDWDNINATNIDFPKDFIFGVGTSAYQVEGYCENTDWWEWEKGFYENGKSHVKVRSGRACDQWNKFEEDIKLLAELGVGLYRFSIAWDKVQPEANKFDQDAIEHYKEMCRELNKYGIKAHIGFHHYTNPLWFANRNGFENVENCQYFAAYCARIIEEFKDIPNVHMWSTFNSPGGYALKGWGGAGESPPGIKNNIQLALTVLKNMMVAHVQAYKACKEINPDAQIGILKNIMQFDPWRKWNPLDNFTCKTATALTDTGIFSFFTTGRFIAKIPSESMPLIANVEYTDETAPDCLDFIGLNYYGHSYIKNAARFSHPDEITTQNDNYSLYPEGLHRALMTIKKEMVDPIEARPNGKHLPIYVTENGTTDNVKDNTPTNRELFFKRYLYALHRAKEDGCDVRGHTLWSFMDNYEWGTYKKKYGIVHVDFNSPDLTRTIKKDVGTCYYLELIRKNRPSMPNEAASSNGAALSYR